MFAEALLANRQSLCTVQGAQRRLAIRVARAYSTISYEAACCVTLCPVARIRVRSLYRDAYIRARRGQGMAPATQHAAS